MRNVLLWFLGLALGACITRCSAAAEPASSFDLSSLPLGQVVSLYYREVSSRPYVVCNDVLADTRLVSVRASGRILDAGAMRSLLSAYGFEAVDQGGVLVVCKKSERSQGPVESDVPFLYRVKYRDSGYLVDLLSPLVSGKFANRRGGLALAVGGQVAGPAVASGPSGQVGSAAAGGVAPSGVAGMPSAANSAVGDDYVVFSGSTVETRKLEALLAQVDVPLGEVLVKAYMYEVGKSSSDASALQLVVNALGGRVGVVSAGEALSNLVRLRTASVDVVASALATDARFKVVTAPFVRLRSGKTARFVSGDQQSVLGAIVTNQNGSTQQSFDRVDSGTILEVSPVVHGDAVDVDLFQQVSSFVSSPGASSGQPPILRKRELRTSLSMVDGEVVVLAGLNDAKDDGGSSGLRFLPFALSKSASTSSSELVLVLEMKKL